VFPKAKISIGVSACLLGEKVRCDEEHKRDNYIADILSKYFDFLPLCQEVAIGLSVPRPIIQLHSVSAEKRTIIASIISKMLLEH